MSRSTQAAVVIATYTVTLEAVKGVSSGPPSPSLSLTISTPSLTLYPRGIWLLTHDATLNITRVGYLLIGGEQMLVLGDGECAHACSPS